MKNYSDTLERYIQLRRAVNWLEDSDVATNEFNITTPKDHEELMSSVYSEIGKMSFSQLLELIRYAKYSKITPANNQRLIKSVLRLYEKKINDVPIEDLNDFLTDFKIRYEKIKNEREYYLIVDILSFYKEENQSKLPIAGLSELIDELMSSSNLTRILEENYKILKRNYAKK